MMVASLLGLVLRFRGLILEVLLDRREVLLGRREIAGLQILCQLAEGLGNRTAALRRRRRILRLQILQGGKIRLRRRQIARLQVLARLLEVLLELLKSVLYSLRVEKAAAGNARNRHGNCLLRNYGRSRSSAAPIVKSQAELES